MQKAAQYAVRAEGSRGHLQGLARKALCPEKEWVRSPQAEMLRADARREEAMAGLNWEVESSQELESHILF